MRVIEFKEAYPQYKDLEGDALWDMMEDVFLSSNEVLTADPNREMFYLDPVVMPVVQDDGSVVEMTILLEDDSKTRWLNSRGEEVQKQIGEYPVHPTESYKMVIWDASDEQP